jgi:hypothetical protein
MGFPLNLPQMPDNAAYLPRRKNMTKVLITVEEFKDRFSISHENFDHLVKNRAFIPFQLGLQTFLNFEDVEMVVCNTQIRAEMAAGLHHPAKPKRTR